MSQNLWWLGWPVGFWKLCSEPCMRRSALTYLVVITIATNSQTAYHFLLVTCCYNISRFQTTRVEWPSSSLKVTSRMCHPMGLIWLKLYSPPASAGTLKVCLHRYRTSAVRFPSRCLEWQWPIISLRATRPRRYLQECTVAGRPSTAAAPRHGRRLAEETRLYKAVVISKMLSASRSRAWWRFTSAADKQRLEASVYDVLSDSASTIPRRLRWLLTWTTTSFRAHSATITMFCTDFSLTCNLRSRRHSLLWTAKNDSTDFLNRLLFKDVY